MNRRGFLKILGSVAGAIAAKPVLALMPKPAPIQPVIGSYADYISVSDFTLESTLTAYYSHSLAKHAAYNLANLAICQPLPMPASKTQFRSFMYSPLAVGNPTEHHL